MILKCLTQWVGTEQEIDISDMIKEGESKDQFELRCQDVLLDMAIQEQGLEWWIEEKED